ncbi:MAG: RecX family transcriptional regulator [Clostridia bacterium]
MIKSIEQIKFEKKRSAVYMDDGETVNVFNATIKEYCLAEGSNYSTDEIKRIAFEGEQHLAFTSAIDSLSRCMKSQNEIRENLKQKKFSSEAIDFTVTKLLGYNYLGDEKYAETYVSFKADKTGRRKIIYDLTTLKGIPKSVAEKVVFDTISDEAELEKAISMATKYIEKEKKRISRLRDKVWNFLAVRGFETDIISQAMSKLDFSTEENE